jgi:putative membrane protein
MRALKFATALLAALIIILLSVANHAVVPLKLWPDLTAYGAPLAPSIDLPLFVIAVLAGAVGFGFGTLRELFREGRGRAEGRKAKKEALALKSKIDDLTAGGDDDLPGLPSR